MTQSTAPSSGPIRHSATAGVKSISVMLLLLIVLSPGAGLAQTAQKSLLQTYTPSYLLSPGDWQFRIFTNLYTQTSFFDDDLKETEQNGRATFLTITNELFYGIHPRVNIGADLTVRSVRIDDKNSSPLAVFLFSGGSTGRTAITSFAPKIKVLPFTSIPNLSIQSTFVFPTAGDPEGRFNNRPFLDFNDWQWWNQIFYDYRLSEGSLIFLETGVMFRFDSDPQAPDHEVNTPLKAFVNYYPSGRWTLYVPIDFTPSWGKQGPGGNHFDLEAFWIQTGLGTKYELAPNFELELLYTSFIVGRNEGAGQTFNAGLRIVR